MHKLINIVLFVVGTALMFAAETGPDQAVSNLSRWAQVFGADGAPLWLQASNMDTWGFWIGFGALLLSLVLYLFHSKRALHERDKNPLPQPRPLKRGIVASGRSTFTGDHLKSKGLDVVVELKDESKAHVRKIDLE